MVVSISDNCLQSLHCFQFPVTKREVLPLSVLEPQLVVGGTSKPIIKYFDHKGRKYKILQKLIYALKCHSYTAAQKPASATFTLHVLSKSIKRVNLVSSESKVP